MSIRHRHPGTASRARAFSLVLLLTAAFAWSPAVARESAPHAQVSLDIISLTCEGLVTYTYSSAEEGDVLFQFSQTPADYLDRSLIGGAVVHLQPATQRTESVQGHVDVDISKSLNPVVTAYYQGGTLEDGSNVLDRLAFPDDCSTGPNEPGTGDLVAQLVAILIAILESILDAR